MEPLPEEPNKTEDGIHPRGRKQDGRCNEPPELAIRVGADGQSIPEDREKVGTNIGGPVCIDSEQKVGPILQPVPKPRSPRKGRLQGRALARQCLREPSTDSDQQDIAEDNRGEDWVIDPGDAVLAVTDMVGGMHAASSKGRPSKEADEDYKPAKDPSKKRDGDAEWKETRATLQGVGRVEIIREALSKAGVEETVQEELLKAERKSTRSNNDSGWRQYALYCQEKGKDPKKYDINAALEHLTQVGKRSHGSAKMGRSAIAQTWKIVHPEEALLSEHPLCKKLFKALRERHPGKPKRRAAWDANKVLERLKRYDNETITLPKLARKAATLLAMATFWRPRSDLSRIELEDVIIEEEGLDIVATKPKEGRDEKPVYYLFKAIQGLQSGHASNMDNRNSERIGD